MTVQEVSAIGVERASEQLRQERETFDQQKRHSQLWFILRLVMGYSAVVLLAGVMVIAGYVLMHPAAFPTSVLVAASAALFVDVLGLLAGVWRVAMNPQLVSKLSPVTTGALPSPSSQTKRKGTTSSKSQRELPKPGEGVPVRRP